MDAPFDRECAVYAAAGFERIELWFPKLSRLGPKPAAIARALEVSGLQPVSGCACEGCLWRGQGGLETRIPEFERNFEMAQALGVPRFVVFSSARGPVSEDDYKVAVDRFVRIAELAARYKVRIAFEFIAGSALCGSLLTSLSLLRAAKQPNTGICLDAFHFFAGISKFEDLAQLQPGEIEHVHFHDVPRGIPREILRDPDRIPPGEGAIPLELITHALRRVGYDGNLSVELFGSQYQKSDPEAVARLCFNAVRRYCRD